MIPTLTRSLDDGSTSALPPTQLASFLVVALDAGQPLRRPLRLALDPLTQVSIGRGARRVVRPGASAGQARLELPDAWLSSAHLRLRRVGSTWLYEDDAAKNLTLVNGVACREAILADGDLLTAGATWLRFCMRPVEAGTVGDHDAEAERRTPGLATLVPSLERALTTVVRVARSEVPVLIRGETGTGKEVLARAVHEQSGRTGAFVPVNCGGLPATLIESELFGARKGAYSGLHADRAGLIRDSHGGTLFLDEVAELPPAAQATLLRVLQDGQVRPIGQDRAVQVSLRLVCATHRDLEAMVEAGQFRRDLYARLAGHIVTLPPVRERREDLGIFVAELLERRAGPRAPRLRFAAQAVRALFLHDWPMNVRELEQCLASALAIVEGDEIGLAQLPVSVREGRPRGEAAGAAGAGAAGAAGAAAGAAGAGAAGAGAAGAGAAGDPLVRVVELLREHRGNVSAVARAMSTSRSQVRRLARRAGVAASAVEGSGDAEGEGEGEGT